jgi:predicted DNA-binding transcriptional regulator AlpA
VHRERPDPTPRDGSELLTIAETAALYGVAPPTISAWLYRGDARLPSPIRYGRNYVRFRRSDVLARIDAIAEGTLVPFRGSR